MFSGKFYIGDFMYRDETERVYKSLYKNWIKPCVEQAMSLKDMFEWWESNDLAPATMRKCVSAYKMYWDPTADTRDVVRKIKGLEPVPSIKAWSREEVEKLLIMTKAWDKELYRMLVVTLHTGMRKGELFGLNWTDIDFRLRKINISRSWDGPTKTRQRRSIPMSKMVEKVLLECYAPQSTGHVFQRSDVNRELKKMCKMAGVSELTWHSARHTFATLALDAGRSPREVADMLGHAKVSTTLDLYWAKLGQDMDLDFLPGGE